MGGSECCGVGGLSDGMYEKKSVAEKSSKTGDGSFSREGSLCGVGCFSVGDGVVSEIIFYGVSEMVCSACSEKSG